IELIFEGPFPGITIDEAVETDLQEEMLLNEDGFLHIKKVWDTSKAKPKAEMLIRRGKFSRDDFLLLSERELIRLCQEYGVETRKANGDEYNNREKRSKLRERYISNGVEVQYVWEKLSSTGTGRGKLIFDELRRILPRFEYFRADTPLSESDASIQRYFRSVAVEAMKQAGVDQVEVAVKDALYRVMADITQRMNRVLPESDAIVPAVEFDWSKVVQTYFRSSLDENAPAIPLSFRGDGFRRIAMMAYFEHLAEGNKADGKPVIFGFEEPETFLHPKLQEQLHQRLLDLVDAGYQVLVTTHSPVVVAASRRSSLIHIKRVNGRFEVAQSAIDLKEIVEDLGIKPQHDLIDAVDTARVLVLVEGPDECEAFRYVAELYTANGVIPETFKELGAVLVPIGGCDQVRHWVNLDVVRQLNRPFIVIQDSDKISADADSPNRQTLVSLGLVENDTFYLLRKRELENYINPLALRRIVPGLEIEFDDFTDVKQLCKQHPRHHELGGAKVAQRHFCKQTFDELRTAFRLPDGGDEFVKIYELIASKVSARV
ncbi:MAG TPA: AAA family ATPase, partial [Acidobacteriota bacterium]|nr:AAA family ATPase [Acidobacteriota bacterium]